jgi:amidohydrolase
MRSFDDETRELLKLELEVAFSVARTLGGDYKLEIRAGYPSTINNADVVTMIKDVACDLLGGDALLEPKAGMGAEDFSYMTRAAPGRCSNSVQRCWRRRRFVCCDDWLWRKVSVQKRIVSS